MSYMCVCVRPFRIPTCPRALCICMCVCVRPSRIPTCLRALCICMYVPVDVRRDILAHLSHLYFNTHVVPFFLPSFLLPSSFLSPSIEAYGTRLYSLAFGSTVFASAAPWASPLPYNAAGQPSITARGRGDHQLSGKVIRLEAAGRCIRSYSSALKIED